MEIRGEFINGRPFIIPAVSFPTLNIPPRFVPFLLDTGADTTLILPDITQGSSRLAYRLFASFPLADVAGFGGAFTARKGPATLVFTTMAGGPHQIEIAIEIAKDTIDTYGLPSVLGRDVIDLFRLTVDRSVDLIALTDAGVPA